MARERNENLLYPLPPGLSATCYDSSSNHSPTLDTYEVPDAERGRLQVIYMPFTSPSSDFKSVTLITTSSLSLSTSFCGKENSGMWECSQIFISEPLNVVQ